MTQETLPLTDRTEPNPFPTTVPLEIQSISPGLYAHLRELTEVCRLQFQQIQKGNAAASWVDLLETESVPSRTLGAIARFYHPTYGMLTARYVRFVEMNPALQPGGPVGVSLTANQFNWQVTNQKTKVFDGTARGVMTSTVVPANDSYGWILLDGINVQSLLVKGTQPKTGMKLYWNTDDSLSVAGESVESIGTVVLESVVDADWRIPPAGLLVRLDSGMVVPDVVPGDPDAIAALTARLNALEATTVVEGEFSRTALGILQRRLTQIGDNFVTVDLTEKLQAALNYSNLAQAAANQSSNLAGITTANLYASNEFTRTAKVYRDETGLFAESVTGFLNEAIVQTNLATASATASQTFSASASNSAAEATAQASLAASYLVGINDTITGTYAAINSEATIRASADNAITSSVTTLSSTVGGLSATVTTQAGTLADHTGKLSAYWTVSAVAGGRAQLSVYADANGGGGVDIIGDLRVFGKIGLFRESSSGARLELEGNQIRGYHTSGTLGLFLGIV